MAGSSLQITSSDKGKGHASIPPPPPALRILNQIDDEIIDDPHIQSSDNRILIPFTIGTDTHCFLGPIESLEKMNRKSLSFPSAEGEDLLINQSFNISHFINQKTFRNNPKINPRGYDFTAWYRCLEPTKSASWGALGIHELLRLSHFSLTTHPWLIGAVTCFWNRTTNNFHLPCGMIGMSLLDVATITRLPINLPDYTSEISYSDFIAHNMGREGTRITDNEHVAFLFYWLNAILFCSRSVQMSKLYLSLAILLHEGCPLWLLQLWLNAIFENFITKPESGHTDKQYIEGFRLFAYKPNFPNAQSDEDRKKEKFKITLYAPHLSARKLGFSQAIPKPQPRNDDPFCHFLLTTQEDFDSCLAMNQQRRDHFNFMEYERSSYITKSCVEWWAAYYARYTRTLEEIQQTAIETAPVTESSPKRTQKRKAETARPPPPAKSRKTPTKTSRKLILLSSTESSEKIEPANKDTPTVSSPSEDIADSDSGPQLICRTKTSQPSHVTHSVTSAEELNPLILSQQHGPRVIPATFPLFSHTTQIVDPTANPLQHSPAETQRIESTSPDNQVILSEKNLIVPDSDSASKAANTTNSDSSKSKVSETPPELQPTPSDLAQLQTPPGLKPSTSIIPTTPSSATLVDLTSILNKIIQGTKVPIPVPVISSPVSTRLPIELDPDTREQLRSLIKLLDHPPATWVNDPILNKLLTSLLSSSFELPTNIPNFDLIRGFKQLIEESVAFHFQFQEIENQEATAVSRIENYQAIAQPIKAARDEFDLKIARAISVQGFHDQEEVRLETELALIQEQLTTLRQNRTTLARPLVAAQQEQHLLIQQFVLIDTERKKVEQQLEEIQTDKSKQTGMFTTLENKRTKLCSVLAKLLAP
ncbi:hypothetical protein Ahy_B09g097516 [Arachis hypogaea]|uniref:Aminotransferase-like plant mobile domain-containing protein n=1 Tax=Arachis hypogaea TaxID=3818 RepID=A0A444XPV2_ARAHY|nr:hypothetical protein Ahy_B09g097516 [Arachis hypogaea]